MLAEYPNIAAANLANFDIFQANVSPLIAEQYTETKFRIKTLKSGEVVIVSPTVTIQSLYNIFYWCVNIGSLSAIATVWMELKIDFWAAYLLPL